VPGASTSPAAKEVERLERIEKLIRNSEEEHPLRVEPLGLDRRFNRYFLLDLHGMAQPRLMVQVRACRATGQAREASKIGWG